MSSVDAVARRAPVWRLAAALVVAQFVVLSGAVGDHVTLEDVLYDVLMAAAAVGCLLRALKVEEERSGWALVATAFAVWSVGDVSLSIVGYTAFAETTYVLFYATAIPGLWRLCRPRSREQSRSFALDVAVGALAVTAAWAVFAEHPIRRVLEGDLNLVGLLSVGYTLGDLAILLVLLVAALVGTAVRGRRLVLLGGGFGLIAVADTIYAWQAAWGNYMTGTLLDVLWPAGSLLVARAAWEPFVALAPRRSPVPTVLLPAAFAGLACVLLTLHQPLSLSTAAFALALAAVLAAVARSAGLGISLRGMLEITEQRSELLTRERRRAQDSEAKLLEANRLAGFGHWEWDLDANTISGSEVLYELMGHGDPSVHLPYEVVLERVHPDDRDPVDTTLRRAIERRESFACEARVLRLDRQEIVLAIRGRVEPTERGATVFGTAEDVTERAVAERAERAAATLFRTAFDDAPVGMTLRGPSGDWFRVNDAFLAMLGHTHGELMLKTPDQVTHPGDTDADRGFMRLAAAGRADRTVFEKRYVHRDGHTVQARVHMSAVRDEKGRLAYFVSQVEDITERMHEEVERRRLESKLARLDKLDSLGTLAGGIAHDFNNLLAVILNFAEFLGDEVTSEAGRRDLAELRSAAEKGAELTRGLLTFARRGVANAAPLEIDRHVEQMERILARTLGEDIRLVVDLQADAAVRIDQSELDQVLMNLAVNARQAMPVGGVLRISTRVLAPAAAAMVAPELPAGEHVELVVVDAGVGMTDEVAQRALDPFFTTKEAGTGLGLATVQNAVARAGGALDIETAPGRGTTIRVVLPRVSIDDRVKPQPGNGNGNGKSPPSSGARESILVVEDEAAVRQATARILDRSGYEVACAANADDALEIARIAEPALVLTDVVLPGMSGTQLAERLREVVPDTKVIFMSGYNEDVTLREGIQRESVVLVEKPFDARTLEAAVRDTLAS